MITRRPFLLGAVAAGVLVRPAWAQSAADFEGEWHGALDLGSQRLRLRLVVAPGPRATLYSVDQGDAEIPAETTRTEGAEIAIAIPSIGASYRGRLADGAIVGEFTQRAPLPLTFTRGEAAAAPAAEALTQARLAQMRAQCGAPGMAAAAANRDGRRIAFADGVRALRKPQAVTTSDQWHLGSITKSMTATLAARAVEAGAVRWQDTIGDVLGAAIPDMRAEYRDATLRHLCSHRAGLQANIEMEQLLAFPRESADSRADRIAYARLGLLQTPDGPREETFVYSNTGYVIVGAMLEAKLGAPWEELIQRHVFTPLGMTSAGFGAPGHAGAVDQPVGHEFANGALVAHPPGDPESDLPAAIGPAGRVHAAFDDVLKYLAAHRDYDARFLSPASWDTLHAPPYGGPYAMGWAQHGDALWHNGSNGRWYAEIMIDRARGIAAVAAVNDGRAGEMGPPVGTALLAAAEAVA